LLDHLVFTVRGIVASSDLYRSALGKEALTFAEGRKAPAFGRQKIDLQEYGKEFEPRANTPKPGPADLCFARTESLDAAINHLEPLGVEICEGLVDRVGAMGSTRSVYIHDPDMKPVESSGYPEFS